MKTHIKKLLNISILFILIIYLSINCTVAEDEKGFGNALIITPKSVPLNKLIGGMTTEEALALNGSVRYEVVVESNGQRIKSVILKNDDSAEISIPVGIKLKIGVGLYLAENGTNDEMINAYLVTDLKKDFIAMPHQTVYLDFTLDFSKPTIVNYYFPNGTYTNAPGMADITGAAIYYNSSINVPVFTVKNLLNNSFNILSFNASNTFSSTLPVFNEGKIFKVDDFEGTDDPTPGTNRKAYWYIDTIGLDIYFNDGSLASNPTSTNPITFIDKNLPYKDASNLFLHKVYMSESIKYDPDLTANDIYYYFFIYKNGMLTIKNTQPADTW